MLLYDLTQKIETVTKKKILASKITRRARLKRKESSIDKRRIYTPMKTIAHLMRVMMKKWKLYLWA